MPGRGEKTDVLIFGRYFQQRQRRHPGGSGAQDVHELRSITGGLRSELSRGLTILALISVAVILTIIFWGGVQLVAITQAQISPALRVSMSVPYLAVPVGAALMFLHTIEFIFETITAKRAD